MSAFVPLVTERVGAQKQPCISAFVPLVLERDTSQILQSVLLTAEAKKLRHLIHLWREYISYRRVKKTDADSAQRHYDGKLLR